jgi:UDP:flavonoid glycosyltransferase YjiC (YdhE family)
MQHLKLPTGKTPAETRILFAAFPADGHFNPLTGLAMHLKAQGYDVRWYTPTDYVSKLQKMGIPYFLFREAIEIPGGDLDKTFPERTRLKGQIAKLNFDIIHVFINQAPRFYADLLQVHQVFPFDALVCDCAFTGLPFVTSKMRIPAIAIGVLPLVESSKDLPPSGLGMTPSSQLPGRLRQNLLRWLADRVLFRKANAALHAMFDRHGIPHNRENVFDALVKKSTLFLQSGTPGFEYHRSDLSPHISFLGALLPYSAPKQQGRWTDPRLTQYQKIILVTQGTVEKNYEKIIVPVLEAYQQTDVLVIATTGGSGTAELRKRYPYRNLVIEDFIPFADVMPYANAYITNGGYGGVMLGIQNGLPLVVAGVHEGKNEINARVGYFKLGINLKTEWPKAAQVKKAVDLVLENPGYRKNVEKLRAEFSSYDPDALVEAKLKDLLGVEDMASAQLLTA